LFLKSVSIIADLINMRIFSLVQDGNELRPVEIEFCLLPGLPQIHYLGLADQVIKESLLRIKSAFRSQKFIFPRTQQVVVNIRPTHIKKTSRGIDLAIAVGILHKTGQLELPPRESILIYGELGLNGQVYEPDDFGASQWHQQSKSSLNSVITGQPLDESKVLERSYEQFRIKNLMDLLNPERIGPSLIDRSFQIQRPSQGLKYQFSSLQSKAIQLAALGAHHMLLAGVPGSGKTTVAQSLPSYYPWPEEEEVATGEYIWNRNQSWWPVVSPHHSLTPLAMIGGGRPIVGGEIVRAHRGVLILDELLEFSSSCIEALREPMESQKIRLARGVLVREFQTSIQVVATTNLCHCGFFVPGHKYSKCKCSQKALERYHGRLSGPILDRFPLIFFFSEKQKNQISGENLLAQIENVRRWREEVMKLQKQRDKTSNTNSDIISKSISDVHFISHSNLESFQFGGLMFPHSDLTLRRKESLLKVARTIADLNFSAEIRQNHLEEALEYSWIPFKKLLLGNY